MSPEKHREFYAKRIGRVAYDPSHRCCYLRVNVPQESGLELSIKASFTGWGYGLFEKGDLVEVQRTDPSDARRYRVTRLIKQSGGHVAPNCKLKDPLDDLDDEPFISLQDLQTFIKARIGKIASKEVQAILNEFGATKLTHLLEHERAEVKKRIEEFCDERPCETREAKFKIGVDAGARVAVTILNPPWSPAEEIQAIARGVTEVKSKPVDDPQVQFFLGSDYYSTAMAYVMRAAFGISHREATRLFRNNREGVTIRCRLDQFALFLIERNSRNIKNGFKDLRARCVPKPEPQDIYDVFAASVGVSRSVAKRMLGAFLYDKSEFEAQEAITKMLEHLPATDNEQSKPFVLDVTDN